MRITFMGTPEFAVPSLDALVAAGHDVVAAYAQPPRPAHRGRKLTPSPVQARAEALGIGVRTPPSLRDPQAQADFAALDLDVAVVAAYGLILPPAILTAPRHGCINVHGSILPRWRGAAPVQRAILAGDVETGVTIMQMDEGRDTGAMRLVDRTPVAAKTAGALTDEIARMGAAAMVRVLADLAAFPPRAQPDEGATYAAKIAKSEARLDFTRDAAALERAVRAYNPFPGAWFDHDGERIRVHAASIESGGKAAPGTVIDDALGIACGSGVLRPTLVQRAGRPRMTAGDLLRGYAIPAGTILA